MEERVIMEAAAPASRRRKGKRIFEPDDLVRHKRHGCVAEVLTDPENPDKLMPTLAGQIAVKRFIKGKQRACVVWKIEDTEHLDK